MRATHPFPKRTAVKKRRSGVRRGPADVPPEKWRNPAFRRFLRVQGLCKACMVETWCNLNPVHQLVAATETGYCEVQHGPPNGRSQKGPDAEAIPGCRYHHTEQTKIGWERFEAKYGFRREAEAKTWWARWESKNGQ